jgi:hypothetical protein
MMTIIKIIPEIGVTTQSHENVVNRPITFIIGIESSDSDHVFVVSVKMRTHINSVLISSVTGVSFCDSCELYYFYNCMNMEIMMFYSVCDLMLKFSVRYMCTCYLDLHVAWTGRDRYPPCFVYTDMQFCRFADYHSCTS